MMPLQVPLDEAAIVDAVASALLRHRAQPAAFQLAGLPDAFLDAGALPTLQERYGISREALALRIKGWLG